MRKLFLYLLLLLAMKSTSQSSASVPVTDTNHISSWRDHLQEVYTVFVTSDVKKCKSFYEQWFGFTPVFSSSWFILLQSPGKKSFFLAFMSDKHPSTPPNPGVMKGDAAFLTLQVDDAKKVYDAMVKAGLKIFYHLKDEDWGQRRFAINDPNGMHIDVVEQIEPKAGYWDKYMGDK